MERWTLSLLRGSNCNPKEKDIEKNRVHSGRHPPAASHMQWGVLRGNTHSVRGIQSCHDGRMRHSEVMTKVGEKAQQATKSESERAGHRSKSGATLAVDRGRRVCRSHEGNGVNMTEKGPVRAYGVRAVCTGTSTPPSAYELNVICTWGV